MTLPLHSVMGGVFCYWQCSVQFRLICMFDLWTRKGTDLTFIQWYILAVCKVYLLFNECNFHDVHNVGLMSICSYYFDHCHLLSEHFYIRWRKLLRDLLYLLKKKQKGIEIYIDMVPWGEMSYIRPRKTHTYGWNGEIYHHLSCIVPQKNCSIHKKNTKTIEFLSVSVVLFWFLMNPDY